MKNIENWLIEWFDKNTDITRAEIVKNTNENYFNKGWIDSFKFINFIATIEEYFNVEFSNDEFQNSDFTTISGLVKILDLKVKNNK